MDRMLRRDRKMSRKSIFAVVGGAALGLLIAAGILLVQFLAAEAECAAVFKREIGETLRETSKDQRKNRHHVWAFAPHRTVCQTASGRLGLLG